MEATLARPRVFGSLCLASLLLRFILIIYGQWQDSNFAVKYSDIDYSVVTDGARLLYEGDSPYDRGTYRYSPLLAWVLLPNIWLTPVFGKLLFVGFDVITALFIYGLSRRKHLAVLLWLWNPVTLGISTRGSSDSIICALVCGVLLGIRRIQAEENSPKHRASFLSLFWPSLLFGLAVHWRIYPVVFAPSFLLALRTWRSRVLLGLISGGFFFLLGIGSYVKFGDVFLRETFTYHITRTDPRHNFSVWFYSLYLTYGSEAGWLMGLASFLPQFGTQAVIAWVFARKNMTACALLQTMAFVAFNKVVTAQYFLWYFCLLPTVVLDDTELTTRRFAVEFLLPWFAAELHWLWWGYRVEFKGESMFLGIWVAGLVFFLVNVWCVRGIAQAVLAKPEGKQQSKSL